MSEIPGKSAKQYLSEQVVARNVRLVTEAGLNGVVLTDPDSTSRIARLCIGVQEFTRSWRKLFGSLPVHLERLEIEAMDAHADIRRAVEQKEQD